MIVFVPFFIILPLAGFIISLLIPRDKETLIARTSFFSVGLHLLCTVVFLSLWLINDHPVYNEKEIVLFQTTGYEFFIDFFFDRITAVYLFVGALLTFLVTLYSSYYLHRESGYK